MRHVLHAEEADNLMHCVSPIPRSVRNGWKYSSHILSNEEYRPRLRFNSYIKIKKRQINQRRLYKFS